MQKCDLYAKCMYIFCNDNFAHHCLHYTITNIDIGILLIAVIFFSSTAP